MLSVDDIFRHVTQSDEETKEDEEDSDEESPNIPSSGEVKDISYINAYYGIYESQKESTAMCVEAHTRLGCD